MARILIVDDEPFCLESSRVLLATQGFETQGAADGPEAIEIAKQGAPDVLVVDLVLGEDLDGIQVAEALLQLNPKMQTIVITGYATSDLQSRIERYPSMQCLAKPVEPKQFIATVKEAAQQQE